MTKETNSYIFNENVKNEFLKTITNEKTAHNYNRIFVVTHKYEEDLGKDLNRFSLEQLEKILYDFEANNRHTIESYARIISSYLNWCVQQGILKNNPLSKLTSSDFDKYVSDQEVFLSEKQLRRYEDQCTNYQDAVIFRLLFEGLSGNQHSEICNLKGSDVDFENNSLHLINSLKVDEKGFPLKFTERTIKVSDRAMELVRGAIDQKTYVKRNGLMSTAASNVRDFHDLVENQYVVKAAVTRNKEEVNVPTDRYVIFRRIRLITQILGVEHVNAKIIQRSGMLYLANQLVQDGEEITIDDLKIVANRYNLKTYFNLKSFLTLENIRKVYPK
ncbi:site-specific integrase [Shimazuella alba]|uniref:Uncharacterized protein n=1 Tax=Shimazuella alba TaxID=2690964 RepID=A0A6I4VYJ3_9BACL|nr:site-specific integrase [Shimazuella alba]MXQ55000.1 hypothetical protein [Shimazuella alba]